MKEDIRNMGIVHEACAEDRLKLFQKHHPNIELNEGDFIKMGFPVDDDPEQKEWMFLEVKRVDNQNRKGRGTLHNDPVLARAFNFGDTFDFEYHEICQIARKMKG